MENDGGRELKREGGGKKCELREDDADERLDSQRNKAC